MTSFVAKPSEVTHGWILIDAKDVVVGRLASYVASRLRGKHRPDFTPHVDCGDHVVIINAEQAKFTGNKTEDKTYHRHTGHPGGIKETTPKTILRGNYPERIVQMAIKRMMPKESPLARKQFSKLRVYAGEKHEHEAQNPVIVDFASMNPKNIRKAS